MDGDLLNMNAHDVLVESGFEMPEPERLDLFDHLNGGSVYAKPHISRSFFLAFSPA